MKKLLDLNKACLRDLDDVELENVVGGDTGTFLNIAGEPFTGLCLLHRDLLIGEPGGHD